MPFEITEDVRGIRAEWNTGVGNLLISAVAGSGKTTNIVELAKLMPFDLRKNGLFVAFNKDIVTELKTRLPQGMEARTFHSLGRKILATHFGPQFQFEVDDRKYRNIAGYWMAQPEVGLDVAESGIREEEKARRTKIREAICKMVNFVMVNLANHSDIGVLIALRDHHEVGEEIEPHMWGLIWSAIPQVIAWGQSGVPVRESGENEVQWSMKQVLSWTDMIYLPNVLEGIRPWQYMVMLIDECQDLSTAQRGLVTMCLKRGGRLVFVGDPHQAINGFAGASCDSVQQIIDRFNCKVLPLYECRRCSKAVVRYAQRLVPHLRYNANAVEGAVFSAPADRIHARVQPRDLIMCRTVAPLITEFYNLYANDIVCAMRGRDLSEKLVQVIKDVAKLEGCSYSNFAGMLDVYRTQREHTMRRSGMSDEVIESMQDRCTSVGIAFQKETSRGCRSFEDLCGRITSMFEIQAPNAVVLTTIHKAKGTESTNAWILRPDLLPHPRVRTAWGLEQEKNLEYVAITRAKVNLYLVRTEDGGDFEEIMGTATLVPVSIQVPEIVLPPLTTDDLRPLTAEDLSEGWVCSDCGACENAEDGCTACTIPTLNVEELRATLQRALRTARQNPVATQQELRKALVLLR